MIFLSVVTKLIAASKKPEAWNEHNGNLAYTDAKQLYAQTDSLKGLVLE
jgi:hypothetical protein